MDQFAHRLLSPVPRPTAGQKVAWLLSLACFVVTLFLPASSYSSLAGPATDVGAGGAPSVQIQGTLVPVGQDPLGSLEVKVFAAEDTSSTTTSDGSFSLSVNTSEDKLKVQVDAPPSKDRDFHPALFEKPVSDLEAGVTVLLIPLEWTIQKGRYEGDAVDISMYRALSAPSRAMPFYLGGATFQGSFSPSYERWTSKSQPIPVATKNEVPEYEAFTSKDSTNLWRALNEIEEVIGRDLFRPATPEEIDWVNPNFNNYAANTPDGGIGVHVTQPDSVNHCRFAATFAGEESWSRPSMPIAFWQNRSKSSATSYDAEGNYIESGITTLCHWVFNDFSDGDTGELVAFRNIQHEFLHALGFGHGCLVKSRQSYSCSGKANIVTSEVSPQDVAYWELREQVFEAVEIHNTNLAFLPSLFGERLLRRGLPPIPTLKEWESSEFAAVTESKANSGPITFEKTGVEIRFSGAEGISRIRVSKYGSSPVNPAGIAEENLSSYRFEINNQNINIPDTDKLTFDSGTEVRFEVDSLRGISNPQEVTIYKRSGFDRSTFQLLQTKVESGKLVANVDAFSEFVFASDTEPLHPPNDPPAAVSDSFSTVEDQVLTVDAPGVLDNDSDPNEDSLNASLVSRPSNGSLTLDAEGSFEYAPNEDYNGTDSFTYEALDDSEAADTALVTIAVEPVNDPPVARADTFQTQEDSTLSVEPPGVLGGDTDPDRDSLSVSLVSGVTHGSLTLKSGGAFTYEPEPNFNGADSLRYEASDPGGLTDTASVQITVEPVNDPPAVSVDLPDDTLNVRGPPLRITNLARAVFDDPDGDRLTLSATSGNTSVIQVLVESPEAVVVKPKGTGSTSAVITANDGQAETSASFTTVVEQRGPGEPVPSKQAVAVLDSTEADTASVDFGNTGAEALLSGTDGGGSVKVSFFPGTDTSAATPATARVDSFANVSPYRWQFENRGVSFDSVDVGFALADTSVGGIGDPKGIKIVRDADGDGKYEEVLRTTFDDKSTPSDSTDDVLIGRGLTGFSTFFFASNDEDSPLPVELASFSAQADGRSSAILTWRTTSETNNVGFDVQHQPSGSETWSNLGFVESKASGGTTTLSQSYQFTAEDLKVGTHRFRLRQMDLDGSATLTDPVKVQLRMEEALRLSAPAPNPTSETAALSFAVKETSDAEIIVYNVLGEQVKTLYEGTPTAGESQRLRLDAGDLSSGTYFIRLRAGNEMRTQRLTVVR